MKKFTSKNTKTIKHSAWGLFWNGIEFEIWLYSYATGSKFKKQNVTYKAWEKDLASEFISFLYKQDDEYLQFLNKLKSL